LNHRNFVDYITLIIDYMAIIKMKKAIRSYFRISGTKYFPDDFRGLGAGDTNRPDAALTGRRDYRGNRIIF